METSEQEKLEVLLAQLQERYDALHKMRDRSMQFVLWILGLGLGMAWLLINENALTVRQRIAVTAFLVAIATATWLFLNGIEHGFVANRRVMIRIETALKLYQKGSYGTDEAILPEEFSRQKAGRTGHFKTLYSLIITVFLLLIILTWTNSFKYKSRAACPSDSNRAQTKKVLCE